MSVRRSLTLAIAILIGVPGCRSKSPSTPAQDELLVAAPATVPATQEAAPTDVFRALFLAMLNNDRAGVEAVILPHPQAEILWTGNPLTDWQRQQVTTTLQRGLTMYEVQPGTRVVLPGGREVLITDAMVDPNRKLYWPILGLEKMPTPLWFQRTPGGPWKVDASPLIGARLKVKEVLATRPHPGSTTQPGR